MKRRILALTLALLLLLLALAGCGKKTGEPRSFTLKVQVGDQVTTHNVTSTKETLGEALTDAGLIAGEEGPFGLFLKTVDGVTVDESKEQWWCLSKSGKKLEVGVDSTPFADGDVFEFTLIEGYWQEVRA